MALVDNYDNTQMNDCAGRGWFPGPWIQWATSRRNRFSGLSKLAEYDANGTAPRCGAFVQRAMKGYNSTDVVAESTTFDCRVTWQEGTTCRAALTARFESDARSKGYCIVWMLEGPRRLDLLACCRVNRLIRLR